MPAPISHDLRSVMTHADAEAERLLESSGSVPLDAMAWLSAHIAAVDHAVYPVVRRSVPDGRHVVEQQRAIASRLARTLRVVERRHSGDALASGLDSAQMLAVLHEHIDAHKAGQSELVGLLEEALSDAEQAIVIKAYQHALEHAPTRPHPHLGRGGLVFRIDALRDRLLDVMDGRNVSVPRVARRQITPGRWGSYWLGQPHDQDHDHDREAS
jgi:hypothetical protein